MRLPELENPAKYTGLYVFDFGGQVAVGYTADEIAVLLESERYRDGKVYRIHRALPDGTIELLGVARERFAAEEAMFFYRGDLELARRDLEDLDQLVARTPPPCRMKAQLARMKDRQDAGPTRGQARAVYATVIIYPAEYSREVSRWLSDASYRGGDCVEGGISAVTDYYASGAAVLERRQWWPAAGTSRPAEEVLATTHLPVQRKMAG
ncbi:MAG: hypothetical protein HY718_11830 [Planctomycetes bacterium]|nr:hypothetical protein [Planctomycetota bacterium]